MVFPGDGLIERSLPSVSPAHERAQQSRGFTEIGGSVENRYELATYLPG